MGIPQKRHLTELSHYSKSNCDALCNTQSDVNTLSNTQLNNNSLSNTHSNDDTLKSLKCIYTNADSLRNKMAELKTVVYKEKPHIIAVTEIKPKNFREIQLADFTLNGSPVGRPTCMLYTPLMLLTSGRGIIIFVHESLSANAVDTCIVR